ncbi:hypothetical protein J6590_063555, partial [Homalodisca vitripennis]
LAMDLFLQGRKTFASRQGTSHSFALYPLGARLSRPFEFSAFIRSLNIQAYE